MVRKEFLKLFAKHIRMAKRGYIREYVVDSIIRGTRCPFARYNAGYGEL
jgi:hypothetical protein